MIDLVRQAKIRSALETLLRATGEVGGDARETWEASCKEIAENEELLVGLRAAERVILRDLWRALKFLKNYIHSKEFASRESLLKAVQVLRVALNHVASLRRGEAEDGDFGPVAFAFSHATEMSESEVISWRDPRGRRIRNRTLSVLQLNRGAELQRAQETLPARSLGAGVVAVEALDLSSEFLSVSPMFPDEVIELTDKPLPGVRRK